MGKDDFRAPRINFFNLGQLLSREDQMTISKTYISAFLDATMGDRQELRKMFMDHRHARHWLPETVYMNQYREPGISYVGRLCRGPRPDGHLVGVRSCLRSEHLARTGAAPELGDSDTRAITLGWNTSNATPWPRLSTSAGPTAPFPPPGTPARWTAPFPPPGTPAPDGALSTASAGYPVLTFSWPLPTKQPTPGREGRSGRSCGRSCRGCCGG